ncbi:MAG: helix-turn-helix domain-containing protein [Desulfovibrionaceae bacterium]|nr:helix-turn-helix domain-containing protein [Desulfovibrionaceae bacterium]
MRDYAKISHAFGLALRMARQQCGIPQDKLAELANIDKSYVSLLEQGKRQPSITILFQLSDALNVSPTDLISMFEGDIPKK